MELRNALEALDHAGAVRSIWLPGMRVRTRSGWCRVVGVDSRGWVHAVFENMERSMSWRKKRTMGIDLRDQATVGCLLALVREASGDPGVFVQFRDSAQLNRSIKAWAVQRIEADASGIPPCGDTEVEAIVSALVRLAQEDDDG